MTLAVQSVIFFVMVFLGVAFGAWVDILRLVSRKGPKWLTPLLDLFFWVTVTLLVLIVLADLTYLELRFYAFIGMAIGGFIYFKYLSRLVVAFLRFSFSAVRKGIKGATKFLGPLWLPVKVLDYAILSTLLVLIAIKNRFFPCQEKDIPPSA